MRPTQLATFLSRTIAARLPVLLVGGPGIGKTSIVEQAAAADKQTIHKVAATAASAIRFDGAKAILLASGGLTGYASLLSDSIEVPIIDGVEAAIQSLVTRALSQTSL